MYLELNESSANVTQIKAAKQCRWGQDFTLVSNDGVELVKIAWELKVSQVVSARKLYIACTLSVCNI